MRKVSTDTIDPSGHTIAAPVVSHSGNTLLSKGDHITPAMGRRLQNWGIKYVFVEGGDDGRGESVKTSARSPIEIKSELYDVFLGTLNNAHMMKIFDAVYRHKLHKLDGEGA